MGARPRKTAVVQVAPVHTATYQALQWNGDLRNPVLAQVAETYGWRLSQRPGTDYLRVEVRRKQVLVKRGDWLIWTTPDGHVRGMRDRLFRSSYKEVPKPDTSETP